MHHVPWGFILRSVAKLPTPAVRSNGVVSDALCHQSHNLLWVVIVRVWNRSPPHPVVRFSSTHSLARPLSSSWFPCFRYTPRQALSSTSSTPCSQATQISTPNSSLLCSGYHCPHPARQCPSPPPLLLAPPKHSAAGPPPRADFSTLSDSSPTAPPSPHLSPHPLDLPCPCGGYLRPARPAAPRGEP